MQQNTVWKHGWNEVLSFNPFDRIWEFSPQDFDKVKVNTEQEYSSSCLKHPPYCRLPSLQTSARDEWAYRLSFVCNANEVHWNIYNTRNQLITKGILLEGPKIWAVIDRLFRHIWLSVFCIKMGSTSIPSSTKGLLRIMLNSHPLLTLQ